MAVTVKQLGQTRRPTELIPGSPDDIHATASKLESRADQIHTVALSLWSLDVKGVWEGDAATSFERAAEQLQPHFDFAEEADRTASRALHRYANALEDAQVNAARAIDVWQHGQHATDAAKREQAVALYGASTELLFDPGEAQRASAERILQIARDEVSDAGNRAASALHNAQSLSPPTVGFWDGVAGTAGDVLRGIGNSVASLGNAMSKHPDESLSFILGLLSMQGGMDVFAGGLALDASGVAAPAGVAVNIAAVGLVASGAGVATASATKLLQQAANEDRVEPLTKDAAGPTTPPGYSKNQMDAVFEKTWGKPKTLQSHFDRHGSDFGATSPGDYAKKAAEFLRRAIQEKLPMRVDEDGVVRVYDTNSNTFGSYNSDGSTRTFYKPPGGQAYFDPQPGEIQP